MTNQRIKELIANVRDINVSFGVDFWAMPPCPNVTCNECLNACGDVRCVFYLVIKNSTRFRTQWIMSEPCWRETSTERPKKYGKNPGKTVVSGRFSLQPLRWTIITKKYPVVSLLATLAGFNPTLWLLAWLPIIGFCGTDDLATKLQSLRLATGKGRIELIDFIQPATLLLARPHHLVSSLGVIAAEPRRVQYPLEPSKAVMAMGQAWSSYNAVAWDWLHRMGTRYVPRRQGIPRFPSPMFLASLGHVQSYFNHILIMIMIMIMIIIIIIISISISIISIIISFPFCASNSNL